MTTINFPPSTIGWMAIVVGVVSLIGLVFIILFFTVGQPFGALNDVCIAVAAISSGGLAWLLYVLHHAQSPHLSQLALVSALVGALVVTIGSVLVIFGVTGWFLAGLYMAAGNALIGLWLVGLNYSALRSNVWPHNLVVFGLIAGLIMVLGVVAIPGIFRGIDAQDFAPWIIVYVGQAGGLGWILLYPIWCIWLGRFLILK